MSKSFSKPGDAVALVAVAMNATHTHDHRDGICLAQIEDQLKNHGMPISEWQLFISLAKASQAIPLPKLTTAAVHLCQYLPEGLIAGLLAAHGRVGGAQHDLSHVTHVTVDGRPVASANALADEIGVSVDEAYELIGAGGLPDGVHVDGPVFTLH